MTTYYWNIICMAVLVLSSRLRIAGAAIPLKLTLFTSPLSWNDAHAHCEKVNMTLVTLDPEVNEHITEIQGYPSYQTAVSGDFWIGLFDPSGVGKGTSPDGFTWSATCQSLATSGASWSAWVSDEPSQSGKNLCVVMSNGINEWKSETCSQQRSFLCAAPLDRCNFVYTDYTKCQPQTVSQLPHPAQTESDCKMACNLAHQPESRCAGLGVWPVNGVTTCTLYLHGPEINVVCEEDALLTEVYPTIRRLCYDFSIDNTALSDDTLLSDTPIACSDDTTTALHTPTITATAESSPTDTTPAASTEALTTSANIETTTEISEIKIDTTIRQNAPATEQTSTTGSVSHQATFESDHSDSHTVTHEQTPTSESVGDSISTTTLDQPSTTQNPALESTPPDMETSRSSLQHSSTGEESTFPQSSSASSPSPIGSVSTSSRKCACPCAYKRRLEDGSAANASHASDAMIKELTVDVTTLSSQRRKKISAGDERQSSTNIGLVSVIALSLVFAAIFFQDFVSICAHLRYGVKGGQGRKRSTYDRRKQH